MDIEEMEVCNCPACRAERKEEAVNIEKDVIRHMELRGQLYDAIAIDTVKSLCYVLDANTTEAKSNWVTPLGNLMGAVMYIIEMHSGMTSNDRRAVSNAIAASIVTHNMVSSDDIDASTKH